MSGVQKLHPTENLEKPPQKRRLESFLRAIYLR